MLNACEISKIADGETRENKLSEIYLRFLEDSNKLVKVEAYKLLGPYIATLHGNKIHEKLIENYLKMTNSSINGLSSDNEVSFIISKAQRFDNNSLDYSRMRLQFSSSVTHTRRNEMAYFLKTFQGLD